jgi:cysteine synthase
MAFTSADLTAIEKAIATGTLRVRFENREVQYQTITELLKARDVIRDAIAAGTGSGGTLTTLASFTKD